MDIKTLSTIIGHVSSTTTLNTYTHITDAMRQSAADKIDRGIGKAKPKDHGQTSQKLAPSTFQAHKGQRRKPGTGCVSQINDHLWEGALFPANQRRANDAKRLRQNEGGVRGETNYTHPGNESGDRR